MHVCVCVYCARFINERNFLRISFNINDRIILRLQLCSSAVFFFFYKFMMCVQFSDPFSISRSNVGCTVGDRIRQKCLDLTAGSLGHWKAMLFLYGEIKNGTTEKKGTGK